MTENPSGSGAPPSASNPPTDPGPRVTREEVRDLSRLRRSSTDKHVAGVAGGLGRHLDIDPVILRVAFVVLTFFGGAGLLVYAACWLLVPADDEPAAKIDLDGRNRNAALIGVGLLAGLLTISDMLGGDAWSPDWVIPLAAVGFVTWLVLSSRERRRERRYAAYGMTQTPPPGTPSYAVPPAPRLPRDPRKRGPVLFWFTLALVALGIGTVGTLDLAGVGVVDSAYPATALGLVALMLLVGAFYGRAGGLILLGLVAAVALAGASVAQDFEGDQVRHAPRSAAAVGDDYEFEVGELVLDLRGVSDVAALDGRTIEVEGNVGHLEVIVPEGVDVSATGRVHGPGGIQLFGHDSGGIDVRADAEHDAGAGVPHLTVNTTLDVGGIEVKKP